MKALQILAVVCVVLLLSIGGGAYASGEWYWTITPNLGTGTLHYTGKSGSATPLMLTATIYNTDPANQLIFDGITLKTDELTPDNPDLFGKLWTTNAAVEIPMAFTVPGGGRYDFTIGQFDLASADPGTYKLKFTAAVEYESVDPTPDQWDSSVVTMDVLPVPEPASILGLVLPLAGLAFARRRYAKRP